MIKVVFIDWNETLSFGKFYGHLAKQNPALFRDLEQRLFHDHEEMIRPWMLGRVKFEDICKVLANDSLSTSQITQHFIDGFKHLKIADSKIFALIQEIRRKGCPVLIATDHMDVFGRYAYPLHHLERFFDGYICSAEVGAFKADKDEAGRLPFFEAYRQAHGLAYPEMALIDNSVWSTDSAKSVGMLVIQIKTPQDVQAALEEIKCAL